MRRIVSLFKSFQAALLLLSLCGLQLQAQSFSDVIIANGNIFSSSNMATFAVYTPGPSPAYAVFDSVAASSVQDVLAPLDGSSAGKFYIAADSFLLKYDHASLQREASVLVPGIRKIAVWDTIVLVTRGFGASGDWVQGYGETNLDLLFSISGISGDCEGIAVKDSRAYVGVPGSFGTPNGKLAIIDLGAETLVKEVDLDTLGNGISRVYASSVSDAIYCLSPNGFGSTLSHVNKYMVSQDSVVNIPILGGASSRGSQHGHTPEGFYGNFAGALGYFSFDADSITRPSIVSATGTGITGITNPFTQTEDLFFTQTDFFSYGRLFHYTDGVFVDSLDVGISPEAIALIEEVAVGRENRSYPSLTLWPSISSTVINFTLPAQQGGIRLMNVSGQTVYQSKISGNQGRVDISSLPSGVYIAEFTEGEKRYTQKFIRR